MKIGSILRLAACRDAIKVRNYRRPFCGGSIVRKGTGVAALADVSLRIEAGKFDCIELSQSGAIQLMSSAVVGLGECLS